MKGRMTWLAVSGTAAGSVVMRSKEGIALVLCDKTDGLIALSDYSRVISCRGCRSSDSSERVQYFRAGVAEGAKH